MGASASERFINCSGSTALLQTLRVQTTEEEPDYMKEGTAAHEAVAHVLNNPELETWEIAGQKFGDGIVADAEMVTAVDMMVGVSRKLITPAVKVYIEEFLAAPCVHPLMYGRLDFATVSESMANIVSYKHGEGVLVEVEENPQEMYYAYMLLLKHPGVRRVVIRVVQPRAHHPDGPVRRWETTAEHIHEWVHDVLLPAMRNAGQRRACNAGKWCRFCPAKLACPLMGSLFEAASIHDPKAVAKLDDVTLGQSFQLIETVHAYTKALREEVTRRMHLGKKLPGAKFVAGKVNRVWKSGAEEALQVLGEEAYEPPAFKSPAQMEELGPKAKMLVAKWAYKPEAPLSVVLESDRRTEIKRKSLEEQYAHVLKENDAGV